MRKLLSLAAIAAAVCTASAANATTFAGTFDVTANQDAGLNGGLVIDASPNPGSFNFNLNNVGSSTTVNLFTIWTSETALNSDDFAHKPISVDFSFTQPTSFDGSVGGTTTGDSTFVLIGFLENGSVNWNDPVNFSFGNGGVLQVNLNNASFNTGFDALDPGKSEGAQVKATFKLIHASAAVPEPATWAMMIGGFGMTGAMLRRRRLVAAA